MSFCEWCGAGFEARRRGATVKRFCCRRCQNNHYHACRKAIDPAFHARALEYQRLWRVREKARRLMEAVL